jgi:hypothetical protein
MNRPGIRWSSLLLAVCAVAAASCSSGTSSQPAQQSATPAPSAQPTAAPSQPAPVAVSNAIPPAGIANGQYDANPDLRCDLLEVKRVSGGALLVRWRIVNTEAAAPKPIYYDGHWGDLYFIDPAENKKYDFLQDASGTRILDVYWGDVPAGQQRTNWAKFPAPPPTSGKIAVHIPAFPPFEDVPVS